MTITEIIEMHRLIELMTEVEGASVTIHNLNPDFDGPNAAISVSGEWARHLPTTFFGETRLEAIREAYEAMLGHEKTHKTTRLRLAKVSGPVEAKPFSLVDNSE